ncbi:hypothetical protein CPB83DRAFT_900392 [Crepidotus variabilis]|uniref:Uncharacterized protein n=1 Tax=Crepidotus variabilis TaxID=179855 RepID=A0A9P6JI17_9AGAR|nr:hypothetical protein CPB83DRAFT_900392 [Crepidotus variabilis]
MSSHKEIDSRPINIGARRVRLTRLTLYNARPPPTSGVLTEPVSAPVIRRRVSFVLPSGSYDDNLLFIAESAQPSISQPSTPRLSPHQTSSPSVDVLPSPSCRLSTPSRRSMTPSSTQPPIAPVNRSSTPRRSLTPSRRSPRISIRSTSPQVKQERATSEYVEDKVSDVPLIQTEPYALTSEGIKAKDS